MRPTTLLLAFLVPSACLTALAEDPPAPDAVQIRSWINDLANSQKQRKFRTPEDRLTAEERKSLEPVKKAYAQLSKHFVVSLPYLVESLKDERFSYPEKHPSSDVFENQSVGAACRRIIEKKLLLQNPKLADDRGIAVWRNLPVNKEWYSRVKAMTLFEMQVDSLDWLLKQPPLRGVSKEAWDEELKAVRSYRDKFVAEGKAVDEVLLPPIEGK